MSPYSMMMARNAAWIRLVIFGGSGIVRAGDDLDVLDRVALNEGWAVSERVARERLERLR